MQTKNKLNLIFDAEILKNALYSNGNRTGIYFTALNILKEFLNRDINLYLYNCDEKILFSNFSQPVIQNAKAAINYIQMYKYQAFIFFVERIKIKKANAKAKKKILNKVFWHFILIFLSPVAKNLKKIKNDISEYNDSNYIFFSPGYKISEKIDKCRKYTILYDTIPLILPDYFESNLKSWFSLLVKSLNSNDNYFVISQSARKDFLKYCPQLNPDKIHTTLLACSENFKPADEKDIIKVKEKYNIPSDKKYIFSLCTLEPRKNLIRTVKTFIEFIKKNNINDMVYVLAGCSLASFSEKLEKETGSLSNCKDRILRVGYVADEDLPQLYSGAQWFVFTSQYEGFGLPPLEAMSCSCPVITSNNSSLPEVVGDSGIMINHDSDEEHIAAYEKYYFDETLRKEYAKKGFERARQFSWKKCADKMMEIMSYET